MINDEELVFQNSKKYKDISEKRSASFSEIDRALEVVKKFIIDEQLVIFGGFAIDINLKLAGHPGIYASDAVPDYDFISPDFYNHSNKLAQILQSLKFENVSSINASHFNSRRVRVNFFSVADISYSPLNVYKKIPKIIIKTDDKDLKKFNGLRIVHPDWQRMDLHRSFNVPFSNPPQEVILHRLEKDMKRFRLVDHEFPIKFNKKLADMKLTKIVKIDLKILENTCLTGMIGYSVMYNTIISFIEKYKKPINDNGFNDFIKEKLSECVLSNISSDFKLSLSSNWNESISLLTDDFPSVLKKIPAGKTQYFNKFLDNVKYRSIQTDNFEILDSKGELVPCYNLGKMLNNDLMKNIHVAHPNHIMLYFLQKYFTTDNLDYLSLYISMKNIVGIAEKIYLSVKDPKYDEFPFFVSDMVYGSYNWSSDYIANIREKVYFISNIPQEHQIKYRPPFGYYPERSNEYPAFTPDNELYKMDGSETTEFKLVELIN